MSNPLKLKQNVAYMMVGNAYYSFCQWLVLILLAKLGTPETVGQFALALSMLTPLILFFNMGMRTLIASDGDEKYAFETYLSVRLLTTLAAVVVCTFVALTFGGHIWGVMLAMLVAKAVETIIDVYYGYAQHQQRLNRIALSMMMRGTLSTALLALVFWQTQNLAFAVLAYSLSWLLVLFAYDQREGPGLRLPTYDWAQMLPILKNGIPLGITALLISLGPNIPRYVLEDRFGAGELGLFASMAYFILLGTLLVNAIGQSVMPVLSRYYAKGHYRAYGKLLLKTLGLTGALGVMGVLAAWLIGGWVLNLVYGPEFARRADLFPLIAVGATLGYLGNILGFATSAAKIYVAQAPAFAVPVTVSLVCSVLFVPAYGLDGAVYTLVLTSLSNCLSPLFLLTFRFNRLRKKEG